MQKTVIRASVAALLTLFSAAAPSRAADTYSIDPMHTAIVFKISHIGLSSTFGTFKQVSGKFTIDSDSPSHSKFELTIKTDSIDTFNAQRDAHLKTPDFFNTKQFPVMTFKSTGVKAIDDGFEVTGDFTLHGTTKSVTFPLKGGKKAEFPAGIHRTGYTAEFTLKRSEFGVGSAKFADALGDDVAITVSFEGTRK
jgi:polyisoprenoid-binding protein YceI